MTTINTRGIYEQTRKDYTISAGTGQPEFDEEKIIHQAMKAVADAALDMAAEEALADVETGVKTTLCDMCPEYDAVVNKQSILALKSRII